MKNTAVVACPGCTQLVRLPTDLGVIHAACPKCRSSWDWNEGKLENVQTIVIQSIHPIPSQTRPRPHIEISSTDNTVYWIIRCVTFVGLICVVGFLIRPTYVPPAPLPEGSRASVWASSKTGPDIEPDVKPLPESGYGNARFQLGAATSTLEVIPKPGHEHHVVKVENPGTREIVCWFFIRKGESYKTQIPPGQYQMKLASGTRWYGETRLFGSGASYASINEWIRIPDRTNYILSLIPTPFGEIHEKRIDSSDF